jgi:hypothetical protein
MIAFLLWCILFVLCWPLALLLPPFRLVFYTRLQGTLLKNALDASIGPASDYLASLACCCAIN